MGSFNVTCSLSDTVIQEGQRTSVQILVPGYSGDFKSYRNLIVGDGCQAFFAPFAFPINGIYADYGRINNIKKDINVKMLEDFFSLDIETIIDSTRDDLNDEFNKLSINLDKYKEVTNRHILQNISIAFFRTEVLEHINSSVNDLDFNNATPYSKESHIEDILENIKTKHECEKEQKLLDNISDDGWNDDYEKRQTDNRIKSFRCMSIERRYINSRFEFDMFDKLPITPDFNDCIVKQYNLMSIMNNELKIILRPSVYGSQEQNWLYKYKFNKAVNNIIIKDLEEDLDHSYDEDNEIPSLIKAHKRGNKLDKLF